MFLGSVGLSRLILDVSLRLPHTFVLWSWKRELLARVGLSIEVQLNFQFESNSGWAELNLCDDQI